MQISRDVVNGTKRYN